MKLLQNATTSSVSHVVECNGPTLFFVRGTFCQLSMVEFLITDDLDSPFISHSVTATAGLVAINAPGKYFLQCRLSTEPSFGGSCVTVSTNQGTPVELPV